MVARVLRIVQQTVELPIKAYQYLISPYLGSRCRFFPSCSEYSLMAIDEYGPAKGICLGIKRFCRCHPWSEGGFDPVPKKIQASAKNVRGIALNNQNKL